MRSSDKEKVIKVKNCVKTANRHSLLFLHIPHGQEQITNDVANNMKEKAQLIASGKCGKYGIKKVVSKGEIPRLKRIKEAEPLKAGEELYKVKLESGVRYFFRAITGEQGNKLLEYYGYSLKHA